MPKALSLINGIADLVDPATLPAGLFYVRKPLTHAQILTLPSTGVEIVPSPGIGKAIVPLAVIAHLDTTAGAYATDGTFHASLMLMYEGGIYIGNPRPTRALLEAEDVFLISLPTEFLKYDTAGFEGNVTGDTSLVTKSGVENKALQVKDDWNGIDDYTAGHADNTLTVTAFYIVTSV